MSDEHSKLPPDRLWQPTTGKWFAVVFGASLAYAILRYHIAGDVAWRHFPLFILNKATSLAAVVFVACSYLIGKIIHWHDHDKALRLVVIKFCGLTGFFMAGVHAFFSLALLRPAYYAKYFDSDGGLNLDGELAISVGVLGLVAAAAAPSPVQAGPGPSEVLGSHAVNVVPTVSSEVIDRSPPMLPSIRSIRSSDSTPSLFGWMLSAGAASLGGSPQSAEKSFSWAMARSAGPWPVTARVMNEGESGFRPWAARTSSLVTVTPSPGAQQPAAWSTRLQ